MKHVRQFNSLALLEHFLNVEGDKCKVLSFAIDPHGHYVVIVEGEFLTEEENEQV